jgi:ketosteroid isomerase-like protein
MRIESGAGSAQVVAEVEAAVAQRISGYIENLTVQRDVESARDYFTEDARLLGPGIDLDRSGVVEQIRAVFDAGIQVQVTRRTLELFVHGDAAYETAQAEDVFLSADGTTADTTRNNMFIRWEKGDDDKWRFARVVLGPQAASDQVPELSEAQLADTVYHHLRRHLDLMMAGEVEEALGYFVNSPDLVYASDGSMVIGWDAVADLMRNAMEGIGEWIAIDLYEPQVYVLGPDAATISVRFEERFVAVTGDSTTVRGNWTVVWKRFSDGWKAVQIGAAHIPGE